MDPKLKAHLQKHFGLSADATEEQANALLGQKVAGGELSVEKINEIKAASVEGEPGSKIKSLISEEVGKQIDEKLAPVSKSLEGITALLTGGQKQAGTDGAATTDPSTPQETQERDSLVSKALSGVSGAMPTPPQGEQPQGQKSASDLIAGGAGTAASGQDGVRVKSVAEQFDHTRKGAYYGDSNNEVLKKNWAARPVLNGSPSEGFQARAMDHPSQFDKAIAGAWFKFHVNVACKQTGRAIPRQYQLTELERKLVDYAIHELPFSGMIGYNESSDRAKFDIHNRKLADYERKSLLDDVTSGGLEAAPIAFDDAVILTPLLHGQLFPLVNLVNINRGRRIEAFSMGNPTFTWGVAEGTPIGLFDTDGFIAAFDTTIYNATGAMSIGLDFESDSPVGIGDLVIQRYGQAALNTLDYVVAVGNGTSQPEGVFNASGVADVASDNSTTGPPSYGDDLGLLFGVSKAFRDEASRDRLVFISNDTTYRRSRNIKVDPAAPSTDQRPLYGVDNVDNYRTLGYSHRIQNDIPNTKKGYFNLGRYRMYRRLGLTVRIERGGKELALTNEELIVVRMRFGGQLELGGAGAIMDDCQS